jgi:hypothetical protein
MRTPVLALAALCATAAAGPLSAQPVNHDDLVQALAARDRQIADLQRRLAELERRGAPAPPVTTLPAAAPAAAAPAKPGEDEAELAALSRTLVQRGGLVLPPWSAEIVPGVAYANREVQGLALASTPEGIPTVVDQRLRDDRVRATLGFRLGLPWDSQIEAHVPYAWQRESRSLGNGVHGVTEDSGIGDVDLAISHQFFREADGWRPDLLGALSWRFPTGRDPFRAGDAAAVAPGAGLNELGARLTALKSSDPMVFFGTLSYAHDLGVDEPVGHVRMGDAIGLDLGAVLAVSPETSVTFGLSQEFRGRTQIDGVGAPGTDTVASTLQIGFDRTLTRRLLFDLTLGVGLTRDAPDYAVQISLPYRFR